MNALDLYIEQRVRTDHESSARLDESRKLSLVSVFGGAPLRAKRSVVSEWLQALQLIEIFDPGFADRVGDQARQPRIAECNPSTWRNAIRLVREALREQRIEVFEHVLLEQLRVQLGDTVDRVTADAGQVRHAHVALAMLVDQ